jgi:hypothetical protein
MSDEDEIAFLMDAVKRLSRPIRTTLKDAPDAESVADIAGRTVAPPDADQANMREVSRP